MILTDVSDTIHADSLALFALNIRHFTRRCHQARKIENSYFDLACYVISDLQVKFLTFFRVVHVESYRMAFEIWKSVQ